ncbi:hypothetical protein ZIOFF_042153 [Zingiber officinale]|uniref:Uncharacterized protein n=1 Tax=Zingiber officinale TaxID=94328 RepID=A0A8J5GEX5_ZINOF|nr:hypothetical protein ZIOFF_042153 [Zingiber officinale]
MRLCATRQTANDETLLWKRRAEAFVSEETPILWSHGMADRTVLFEASKLDFLFLSKLLFHFVPKSVSSILLSSSKFRSNLQAYPDVGHSITTEELLHLQLRIKDLRLV